jgi:hypothetical protein
MQKALFVKEIGKPMVLGERPVPQPPKGYILIKVHSTMRKLTGEDLSHESIQVR